MAEVTVNWQGSDKELRLWVFSVLFKYYYISFISIAKKTYSVMLLY